MPMPDGRILIREREATLPKIAFKATAPQRERFQHLFAGGYADLDGHHIPAMVFIGDGVQREHTASIATVRRLLRDPSIRVEVDQQELAKLEAAAVGKDVSEADVMRARLAELESELAKIKAAVPAPQAPPVPVEVPPLVKQTDRVERTEKDGRKR
ncbi:MAG: hypothetical protein ACYDCP_07120 [Thermoplasmataceae archaeon]